MMTPTEKAHFCANVASVKAKEAVDALHETIKSLSYLVSFLEVLQEQLKKGMIKHKGGD